MSLAQRKAQFRRSRRQQQPSPGVKLPPLHHTTDKVTNTQLKEHHLSTSTSASTRQRTADETDSLQRESTNAVTHTNADPGSTNTPPLSLTQGIASLVLRDLSKLAYRFKRSVDAIPMVVDNVVPKLPYLVSLDRQRNDKIEGMHLLLNVVGKAFQAFDNALKIMLDNLQEIGDHQLIKILAIAAKLALCRCKSKTVKSSVTKMRQCAETALRRCVCVQDIVLVFVAQHMLKQAERTLANAPPRLKDVTVIQNALENAHHWCQRSIHSLLRKPLPEYVNLEVAWTGLYKLLSGPITPAQLHCIPNIKSVAKLNLSAAAAAAIT